MIKQKIPKNTTENIASLNNEKEGIESSDKKTSHSLLRKQNEKSSENGTMGIPKVINTFIEKEHLNDISLSDNENTAK